jgi:hypothetical protein
VKNRGRWIAGLSLFLLAAWFLSDHVFMRTSVYEKAFEYSFQGKSWRDIRNFVESQGPAFARSFRAEDQMFAAVNMLEGFHYLLYNGRVNLKTYYNFARIMIAPGQRTGLRDESRYEYEAGKYLRKMKNLKINYLNYDVSYPLFKRGSGRSVADVFVVRAAVRGREYIRYRFQKVQDRYFLSLRSGCGPGVFRLDDSSQGDFVISRPREKK